MSIVLNEQVGLGRREKREVDVEVLLDPGRAKAHLIAEVRSGLTSKPKELTPRWLYDERGSLLFDEITRLPEYYPTRRERSILRAHAHDVAKLSRAQTLVELGAGFSEKTRVLLEELQGIRTLRRFIPFDVSESALRTALMSIATRFSGLHLHGIVGDFEHDLGALAGEDRRLVAFLGGTIGNLKPEARAHFLGQIASSMKVGDSFLLGCDLRKDVHRLEAAYNDSAGVTAAFNLNVLNVLNRELGGTFDPDGFEHVARFDEQHSWIEMLLRAKRAQHVFVAALEEHIRFDSGELMRTEVSTKFTAEQMEEELGNAGLHLLEWWTDDAGDFAVSLSTVQR